MTLGIITAPIYSRFAESEFDRQHGAHHIASPCKFPPFQSPSRPETILLDHTSRWSIHCCSFRRFRSINLYTAPRFTKPGSSSITMVHDTIQPLFLLRPVACTIPPLRGHSLVFPRFPHHSYLNIQSAVPFGFSPLPIYSDKNPRHKRELKLPRTMIHDTMPTKMSKGCAPAANGNRTVPPPLPACQHQPPPPVPTKETMSGADSSLAVSLNTAYYPPPMDTTHPNPIRPQPVLPVELGNK